ncbi:hypothetical protein ACH5RR_000781 [Cinchona calisaya]|uniref:Telomerase reverse transcriptase n=1 Tax=Cinchona calisaya TaxID=153742 RepID=A0ABD3B1K8_9GENT
MSYLLRPKDSPEYRKLLNQCFVVVPDGAPPFSRLDPHNRWPQLEIVRRTIEMIMCEQRSSSNVICSGYNEISGLSSIVECLTSSVWCLLLRRVGDILMVYLLRHTLIFLPLPQRKHHQVAGFPISDLFSKNASNSKFQYPSKFHHGSGKKRKRVGVDAMIEKQKCTTVSGADFSSSSASCIGCSSRTDYTPSSMCCGQNFSQKDISRETAKGAGANFFSTELCSLGNCQESSNPAFKLPRKRVRKYSWQRHRKRKRLSCQVTSSLITCSGSLSDTDNLPGKLQCQVTSSLITCSGSLSDTDNLPGKLQWGVNTNVDLSSEKTMCSCCLVFQTLPRVITKAQINRQSIFYKLKSSSSIFPRKHILNSVKPNSSGASILFKEIFGLFDTHFAAPLIPCFHSNNSCSIKSTCLYHSLMKQLKILIRKARGCQISRLLDKHCGSSSLDQENNRTAASAFEVNESERNIHAEEYLGAPHDYQFQPSRGYCMKKQVVSFIWAVCRSIVPQDLLGSPSNWRILRKNISKFVRLRRFEKFCLKQCIHKLKFSKFSLLSNKHSFCYLSGDELRCGKRHGAHKPKECSKHDAIGFVKHKILECWILWFFSCLVVPLVQANFYVTESEEGKQEVFYYKKSVWKKLMGQALNSLKDRSYHEINDASVHKIISSRSFGFSRIRFRPREGGFRVLANLKAPSRFPVKSSFKWSGCSTKGSLNQNNVRYTYFKSVNNVLRGVHIVLKGIQVKEPGKLGSSVFDYTGFYKKFVPFLQLLKRGSSTLPAVFIIVSDVAKAFDSIDHNKLLSALEDIISNDEYCVNKSLQVICTKKSTLVCQQLSLPPQDNIQESSEITTSVPTCTLHSIFVKEEQSRKIKKAELFSYLNEHIKRNMLQLDDKFYLQDIGISQGSILSSLLCSFYYGHLENNVIFPYLEKACKLSSGHSFGNQKIRDASSAGIHHENEIVANNCKYQLFRFIDDFLFISTSKKQASLFFSRLNRGFRAYNCYMNEGKFGVNFDMDHVSGFRSNRLYVSEDGISFLRWSGLLVNCSSLEILADYTRYLNSHLSSSLTVSWHDHPARLLKFKLCDYLRPKCHPIFYDTNINSAAVVRLNIYQAFLLCAMKFNCYICSFSCISTFSSECCFDAIETALRYMCKLIKRRMHTLHLNCGFRPIFQVGKEEIKWLGLTAFSRVLTRKQSRYRELLLLLRSKLTAHCKANNISSALRYAVDDAHSSLLWKIKY